MLGVSQIEFGSDIRNLGEIAKFAGDLFRFTASAIVWANSPLDLSKSIAVP
jgi:hypothetical protein